MSGNTTFKYFTQNGRLIRTLQHQEVWKKKNIIEDYYCGLSMLHKKTHTLYKANPYTIQSLGNNAQRQAWNSTAHITFFFNVARIWHVGLKQECQHWQLIKCQKCLSDVYKFRHPIKYFNTCYIIVYPIHFYNYPQTRCWAHFCSSRNFL